MPRKPDRRETDLRAAVFAALNDMRGKGRARPWEPGSRTMARMIETYCKKRRIGSEVLSRELRGEALPTSVARVARRHGLSDRYVWGCIKQAREMHAWMLANLDASRAAAGPQRPIRKIRSAGLFLIGALMGGPRRATEVQKEGKAAGHAPRTLRRAVEDLGYVKIRKFGGRGGHSIWELSAQRKKILGIRD